ncbi:MAG: hypothetical protein ACI9KE_003516 [Polyangiales bacterium]|jgi:hypothetical protein
MKPKFVRFSAWIEASVTFRGLSVMMTRMTHEIGVRLVLMGCLLVVGLGSASAQEAVESSGRVTARSDVRMSIESGPATRSTKLAQIGDALGGQIGAIRECYRTVVRVRPQVQGTLRFMVDVTNGGQVEVSRDELNDEELLNCSVAALRGAPLGQIHGPGAAFITLTYSNSAASGVAATQARRAVEDDVEVTRNADGDLEASGGNATGEVAFRVLNQGARATEERVAAMQRSLRAAIPILLDCRRKAARRSSPAGDITLIASVPRRGRVRLQVRSSTVVDDRGGRCLRRFLARHPFEEAAAGRSIVVVTFTGNEAMPVRSDPDDL